MAERILLVQQDSGVQVFLSLTDSVTLRPINLTSPPVWVGMAFVPEGSAVPLAVLTATPLSGVIQPDGIVSEAPPYDVAGVGGRCVVLLPTDLLAASGNYVGEVRLRASGASETTVYERIRFKVRSKAVTKVEELQGMSFPGVDLSRGLVFVGNDVTPHVLAEYLAGTNTCNVLTYGAKGDGVADDTAAVNAAIAAVVAAGGGTVTFPRGRTFLCLGAIVIPYTGTNTPRQVPIRLEGEGHSPDSYLGNSISAVGNLPPIGGATLDLRYSGGTAGKLAKIDTRGGGFLEICHLNIIDGGTSNYRFIRTTNTTLHIHHCRFTGNAANSGQSCVQDCIQLGGDLTTNARVLDTDADNSGFQGYGTVIGPHVHFSHMRRCVEIGSAGNSIVVTDCIVDFTCGSSETTDAPFVLYGNGYQTWGNIIRGGTVEVHNYPYACVLYSPSGGGGSNYNVLDCIGTWDEQAGVTQGVAYFDANSTFNRVVLAATDSQLELTAMCGPGAATNVLIPLARFAQFPSVHGTSTQDSYFLGAVGVGNASPQRRLDVGDGAGDEVVRINGGNSGAGGGAGLIIGNAGGAYGFFGNASVYTGGAFTYTQRLHGIGGLEFAVATSVAMTISAGRVVATVADTHIGGPLGVGTTSPVHLVDAGDGTGQRVVRINGGATNSGDGGGVFIGNAGNTYGFFGNASVYSGGAYSTRMLVHGPGGLTVGNSATAPVGFYGSSGANKPTISGSRGGNAALASLLTALAALGLITDSTT